MNRPDGIMQSGSRCESALASSNLSGDVLSRLTPAATKMKGLIKPALLLAIVSVCLFGYVLHSQSGIFREFQEAWLSADWMLLVCLAAWCSTFVFLTFRLNDLMLIGLLLIAIAAYFIISASSRAADAIILLAGVTLGKGTQFLLKSDGRWQMADGAEPGVRSQESGVRIFLIGLIGLLAFGSWWHLDVALIYYPGTRWTGLWDNPNIYGMLMGVGVVLAIGLLVASLKSKVQSPKSGESASEIWKAEGSQKSEVRSQNEENRKSGGDSSPCPSPRLAKRGWNLLCYLRFFAPVKSALRTPHSALLIIAVGMMAVGLVFSYSRGAWLGTAAGLLYLAKTYGKFKWRYVVTGFGLVALGVVLFWGRTPDNASWIEKRMDFGRASAQHRVAAWKAGFEIMWDHPFGVGWNKAVATYQNNYSPPENGAAALTMNSYMMLGTELGLPGLVCFVAYVGLCFRSPKPKVQSPKSGDGATLDIGHWTLDSLKMACRAGALVFLVAFWFDGGLFTLATASVFWVLLELGSERQKLKTENGWQLRHLTPALSPVEAERVQKSEGGKLKTETSEES